MKDKPHSSPNKPGRPSDKKGINPPGPETEDLSFYQEQAMMETFTEEEKVRFQEMGMKKPACARRLTDTCAKIPDFGE